MTGLLGATANHQYACDGSALYDNSNYIIDNRWIPSHTYPTIIEVIYYVFISVGCVSIYEKAKEDF